LVFLFIAGIVFFIDQLTKLFIRQNFQIGESIPVVNNFFHITRVQNRGAAFGLMPEQHLLLILVALFVVVFLALYFWRKQPKGILMRISLGTILGGAVGNLTDRLFIGNVTDFLDFCIWPVFNIADSAIVVGIVLILVSLFKKPRGKLIKN